MTIKAAAEVFRIRESPKAANKVWTRIPAVTPKAEISPAFLPPEIPLVRTYRHTVPDCVS